MKEVVYTDEALRDIEEIAEYLSAHYPTIASTVQARIRAVVRHIGYWPEGARRARGRRDTRVIPLGRYPYKVFYRITDESVEILHAHHAARKPWAG